MKSIKTLALLLLSLNAAATVVRFETTVGSLDIEMYDEEAPVTVNNFLNYVNDGDYDNTVIHRTDPGFIIQGGGYRFLGNSRFESIPLDSNIVNEAQISNTIGTISMARNTNPNSANSQWFFNMANNTGLDPANNNAGFAVFGKVIKGMDTLYLIESMLRINFFDATPGGSAVFGEFPLYRYDEGTNPNSSNPILDENVIKIIRAYVLTDEFQITEGLSGAWFNPETNGQGFYLEVLPSANTIILAWFTYDATTPDPEVPSTVGDASNRWLTAAGSFDGNVFVGQLLKTGDGLFDDPTAVVNTVVGEVSIVFQDCGHAILSYVLNESGLNNTVDIQRISGANIDFCENLADQANPGITTQ